MHLDGQLQLSLGQASVAGVKADNEDSIGIRVPEGNLLTTKGACAVIADGVSAAEAGKEASDTCVTNFLSDYFSTPDTWTVKKSTQQVLIALNRWLYGQGQRFLSAEKGYVSTLSIAIFKSHTAHLFHVGDSRIYRFRGGDLECLTQDHATRINPQQSYLTRAMGLDVRLDVDYRAVDIEVGDIFFLSTDGVHDFIRDADIRSVLATLDPSANEPHYENLCQQLIADALANDSKDNLSCQIIRIDSLPLENSDDVYRKLTALPFPPYLEPGMIVDGYRVERELHASNRSQLYLVSDKDDASQRYVMKTPSVNFEDDPAYIERFIMESWIGSRIDSPYVIDVIQAKGSRSCLYYLTEYVDGLSATAWSAGLPPTEVAERIDVFGQIVKGVRALHRKETLHQDLKPDNILVDANGQVTIIDFGSCLVAGIAEIAVPIVRDMVLGTANYSAPEPVLGRKSGPQADIFSAAVVAFEMLAGQQPFEGNLENCRSLQAYSNLKYIPCYHYNPHVPIWMDGALKKALSISPELRYPDISEFLYDLQHPNSNFMKSESLPLIQRNPLRVWQSIAALLLLTQLVTLAYFL